MPITDTQLESGVTCDGSRGGRDRAGRQGGRALKDGAAVQRRGAEQGCKGGRIAAI